MDDCLKSTLERFAKARRPGNFVYETGGERGHRAKEKPKRGRVINMSARCVGMSRRLVRENGVYEDGGG